MGRPTQLRGMILIFQWKFDGNTIVEKVENVQVESFATPLRPLFAALTGLPLDYYMQ